MERHLIEGLIGFFCISLPLWLLSSWRLLRHLEVCSRCRCCMSSPATQWVTLRRTFHILLWLATTVEAFAYAHISGLISVSSNPQIANEWAYILLDLLGRSMFEFLAYASVTLLWFQTAVTPVFRKKTTMLCLGVLTSIVVLLGGLTLAVVVSIVVQQQRHNHHQHNVDDNDYDYLQDLFDLKQESFLFRLQMIVEAIAWGIHAVFVMVCLYMTAVRILENLSTFDHFDANQKVHLLIKALGPMSVCSICYAVRSGWLLVIILYKRSIQFNNWVTWIGFAWAPTFIVSTMLLYSARKRDEQLVAFTGGLLLHGGQIIHDENHQQQHQQGGDDDESSRRLLFPTPVPPAEAFLAFRRFNNHVSNHDDHYSFEDDSYSPPFSLTSHPSQDISEEGQNNNAQDDEENNNPSNRRHQHNSSSSTQ